MGLKAFSSKCMYSIDMGASTIDGKICLSNYVGILYTTDKIMQHNPHA